MIEFQTKAHRRFNPLRGEWVLVSPHRTQRPWQGQIETEILAELPSYDPDCYLCPGNARVGGVKNPDYEGPYVFDNDFPAMVVDPIEGETTPSHLLSWVAERGICRVVCFSPRHDLTLALMQVPAIRSVVDTWADEYSCLGAVPFVNSVQIFENRGAMMGASNPHPHGQIWANSSVPNELAAELSTTVEYSFRNGSCMLCDYVAIELNSGSRLVFENLDFIAVVPFWATWPFETMILPKAHATGLDQISGPHRSALAEALKALTSAYDKLFGVPFPYTMGFHQRPTDGGAHPEFHLHAHFYPPLLRSATIRKHMVGYEMLGMPQRDMTPEAAAERLRQCFP